MTYECRITVSPQRFDVPVRIVGKRSATGDGQPLFTLELKPDSVPLTFTFICPKSSGTAGWVFREHSYVPAAL